MGSVYISHTALAQLTCHSPGAYAQLSESSSPDCMERSSVILGNMQSLPGRGAAVTNKRQHSTLVGDEQFFACSNVLKCLYVNSTKASDN